MITVIIPAINEQRTNADVVNFCLRELLVNEVITVEGKSNDKTISVTKTAGTNMLVSNQKDKGISVKDAILSVSNQLLVFLDANIPPYPVGTIRKLVAPLKYNGYDFVKGAFAGNEGRLKELVAKPLLQIFYPELSSFQQPISGMIAAKKCFLNKIDFFHDCGMGMGILKDIFLMHARIKEVNIGYIEHETKAWTMFGETGDNISRAKIKKATN